MEYMVKRRTTPKTAALKVLIVFGAVILSFVPLLFGAEMITFIPFSIGVACWGSYMLFRRLNVEFEYIITNGEMDVDRILGKVSRRRVATADCRGFEILAPYRDEFSREYKRSVAKVFDASSGPGSDNLWFCVFNGKDGKRVLLIFEPNGRMMEIFKLYIPRKIKQ